MQPSSVSRRGYVNENIFITTALANPARFSFVINPSLRGIDEIRVKAVHFHLAAVIQGVYTIWSSITSSTLCSVADIPDVAVSDIVFQFNNRVSINGSYNFEVRNMTGAAATNLNGVNLCIHLELITYV